MRPLVKELKKKTLPFKNYIIWGNSPCRHNPKVIYTLIKKNKQLDEYLFIKVGQWWQGSTKNCSTPSADLLRRDDLDKKKQEEIYIETVLPGLLWGFKLLNDPPEWSGSYISRSTILGNVTFLSHIPLWSVFEGLGRSPQFVLRELRRSLLNTVVYTLQLVTLKNLRDVGSKNDPSPVPPWETDRTWF